MDIVVCPNSFDVESFRGDTGKCEGQPFVGRRISFP